MEDKKCCYNADGDTYISCGVVWFGNKTVHTFTLEFRKEFSQTHTQTSDV